MKKLLLALCLVSGLANALPTKLYVSPAKGEIEIVNETDEAFPTVLKLNTKRAVRVGHNNNWRRIDKYDWFAYYIIEQDLTVVIFPTKNALLVFNGYLHKGPFSPSLDADQTQGLYFYQGVLSQ